MQKKKIIIGISVVAVLAILIGGFALLKPSEATDPNQSDLEKIESYLREGDYGNLYDMLWFPEDYEKTKEEFVSEISSMIELTDDSSGFYSFGKDAFFTKQQLPTGGASFSEKGEITSPGETYNTDSYLIEDDAGTVYKLTPIEEGRYFFEIYEYPYVPVTVYAPVDSEVTATLSGQDKPEVVTFKYNETNKYYMAELDSGKYDLSIAKEGCDTHTQTLTVGQDTDIKVNLNYTEDYLEEYKEEAKDTLHSLLKLCADGSDSLAAFTFKNPQSELIVKNLVEDVIRDIDENVSYIRVGEIRFDEFTGEKVSHYDENDGSCVAKLRYEYIYLIGDLEYIRTGDATIVMEKLNGEWLLKDAYFSMYTK